MPVPRVLVLRAPGTNCDAETAYAFNRADGRAEIKHVNQLLAKPEMLQAFQVLCIPGGFSYGDDVAAGRILAAQMQNHLGARLREFKDAEKLILGICNGFQVLLKSGLLLDENRDAGPPATLTWNDHGRYEDRWVSVHTDCEKSVFFRGIESMYLPIAHAEGKFVARDPETLEFLRSAGQLALRYARLQAGESQGFPSGSDSDDEQIPFPHNPNGSQADVAGVCDPTGRVCGMMPHPERHIDPTNHPRWTRLNNLPAEGHGMAVFKNAVAYFE